MWGISKRRESVLVDGILVCAHPNIIPLPDVAIGEVCPNCWHCVKCGRDFSLESHLHPHWHSCYFTSKQIMGKQAKGE